MVSVCAVMGFDQPATLSNLPPAFQQLLDEFSTVFEKPDKLPPSHDGDHVIPLVPGVIPVSVHPYCYPAVIKDQIG